jgi:hypothetical protein
MHLRAASKGNPYAPVKTPNEEGFDPPCGSTVDKTR